ncbi:hypothetical protein COT52_02445 [candidate division WWE3 bacterium CG08_land_8_20_14_0_20_43_13]|uniref:Rod shape-determining protein MreD n=1 Tax=candidate division WWE3 bacterium CG08_land_8_20_14_0_20_43_13 TaxID=1975087 RepID=A0A2H0X6X7_UNCKA|nr:MAG: hypothetical protein COT52_02445 [candidate division WWE3 bacterium CG08_land_8_20_14_0_20_43_13]
MRLIFVYLLILIFSLAEYCFIPQWSWLFPAIHLSLPFLLVFSYQSSSKDDNAGPLLWLAFFSGFLGDIQSNRVFGLQSLFFTAAVSFYILLIREINASLVVFCLWFGFVFALLTVWQYGWGYWSVIGGTWLADLGIGVLLFYPSNWLASWVWKHRFFQLSF